MADITPSLPNGTAYRESPFAVADEFSILYKVFKDGKFIVFSGAIAGMLGVLLGAFGSHVLRVRLSEHQFYTYQTGIVYHLVHAVMIVLVGTALESLARPAMGRAAATIFLFGIVFFSGSLYLLPLSGLFGAIAPLGGLFLIAGWALLAWSALPSKGMRAK